MRPYNQPFGGQSWNAAYSLVELMIGVGIGAILLLALSGGFGNFRSRLTAIDESANAKGAAAAIANTLQSVFARRNTSLDLDASSTTRSVQVGTSADPSLTIRVRSSNNTAANVSYRFYNKCLPAPDGAGPLPSMSAVSSCVFRCPAGKASVVMLDVAGGGRSRQTQVTFLPKHPKSGALGDAHLCVASNDPVPTSTTRYGIEIILTPFGVDPKTYGKPTVLLEVLNLEVRDPYVELTGI